MRRLRILLPILSLLVTVSACKRAAHEAGAVTPDKNLPLVSVVNVSDPAASAQLVRGFYGLEANAWRWTMRDFTVALKPPPGAAQNGARLNFKFTIPDIISSKLGQINLRATVNGLALPPEAYSKPGAYTYARDVPGNALSADAVSVEFACDKALPPSGGDARELALIASSISLDAK